MYDHQQNKLTIKNRKLLATSAAVIALVAVALWIVSDEGQYLLLRNAMSGKVLFCEEAADGESFSVSFIHSVNKSPVSEHYQIRDSKIFLTELRYQTFGAGMPTEPEEAQQMRFDDDAMVIDGFEREMPYLCYYIGRIAEHTLYWHDDSIPLQSLDEPGQPVSFSTAAWPRFLIWIKIYPKDNELGREASG